MASNPSQKIITLEAFKGELEATVTTLTKMAEEQLKARDAPITFNRDSLIRYIKWRMPHDEYIIHPKPIDIPAGLGPYLYKLPRELRDQIFSHLLASGHPNFMRTSKLMEQQGRAWVAKEGICRINLGYCNGINCQKPSQQIAATIQNVNIRINNSDIATSSLDEYPELSLLDIFAGPTPHRKTCNVSFDFYENRYFTVGHVVLSRLQHLRGFEKVVLRIWMNWTGGITIENPSENFLAKIPFKVNLRYRAFERARIFLEPHLGQADLRSDKDGWYMVFYPRRAQEKPRCGSGGN